MKADKLPMRAWAVLLNERLMLVDSRLPIFWRRGAARRFAYERGFRKDDYEVVKVTVK